MKSAVSVSLLAFACLCLPLTACQLFYGGDEGDADAGPTPDADPPPPDARPRPDASPIIDGGACNPVVTHFTPDPAPHVPEGQTVTYTTNPPSSGPHYPRWAKWASTCQTPTLRREYYVHNLEHGGVVLLFNCSAGPCPDLLAQLQALQTSLDADSKCVAPLRTRTLIVADPLLPPGVQVAAASWAWTYTASCFDAASLTSFYDDHFGHGSEDTCAQGSVP